MNCKRCKRRKAQTPQGLCERCYGNIGSKTHGKALDKEWDDIVHTPKPHTDTEIENVHKDVLFQEELVGALNEAVWEERTCSWFSRN